MAKGADVNAKDVSGRAGSRGVEWAGEPLVKTTCTSKRRGAALRNSHGCGRRAGARREGGRAGEGAVQ